MWLYDKAPGAYVTLVLSHINCFMQFLSLFKPESCKKMKFFEEKIFLKTTDSI